MTSLTRIKLLVAAAGLSVWAMGVRMGNDRMRWVGIVLLAIATLLRFFRDREIHGRDDQDGGDAAGHAGRE